MKTLCDYNYEVYLCLENIITKSPSNMTISGFDILELVIGIIFIYFILSLICSSMVEIIANAFNLRAGFLGEWLFTVFKEGTSPSNKKYNRLKGPTQLNNWSDCLGKRIWQNFNIDGLSRANGHVSYLPSAEFARALFQEVVEGKGTIDKSGLRDPILVIEAIKTSQFLNDSQRQTLLQYIAESGNDLQAAEEKLAKWYDKAMERLSGAYKRYIQVRLFITGFIVAAIFNADTITLSQYLYSNPTARASLADAASHVVQDIHIQQTVTNLNNQLVKIKSSSLNDTNTKRNIAAFESSVNDLKLGIGQIKSIQDSLREKKLPLGWDIDTTPHPTCCISTWGGITLKILGLLLTGLALSLGSSFWFDLLNKLVNLRAAGKQPADKNKSVERDG